MSIPLLSHLEYLDQSLKQRLPHYEKEGRLYHVMVSQQFSHPLLQELFGIADHIKKLTRRPQGLEFLSSLLKTKRAMLYFTQPSTRTFLSFLSACQLLGMDTGEVRDPSLSSEMKGESQEDGFRTFSSYFDLIIMRDPKAGFCEYMGYLLDRTGRSLPIFNGGSGKDQHPTQALLDVYTMHRSFQKRGGLSKKVYGFVGDLLRGRAVRSAMYLLSRFDDIEMRLIAPPEFQIAPDLEQHLREHQIPVVKVNKLQDALPELDCLYMTRIQDEYDVPGESKTVDYTPYYLSLEDLDLMKDDAIILHPLPRRSELDPRIDSDPRAMYWRGLRNGMYLRAALILYVFKMEHRLLEY